ncbi:PQQ-binding-like beta-propeller repeat protein [Actinoplanes subtropicus]|uniref:outer membrane protein assembly factor BamB family protein n=1 Tax=Actinoplanes subtropicus TaxID=543632 RepID=UPI0004C423BD|nr:PQQ-binding-like beta-propeller repeat protein [Actinoplanes subtropicus]
MALIELDLTAQPEARALPVPPAYRYRLPGLLLAAVLVLVCGGASTGGPLQWSHLGVLPLPERGDIQFRLAGDRIFTITSDAAGRTATVWRAGSPPRRLWSVPVPVRESDPAAVGYGGIDARPAGDVVLVSDGPATIAVDARTGAIRWRSPDGVTPLPGGRIGLTQTEVFRPGTAYDQDSGEPGPLYFSSTGEPHTEPPIRTEINGVDLRTGARVWTASAAGSVNVFTAPGDDPAVLVLASDRLVRRNGVTGAVERGIPLPKIGGAGPVGGTLADGLLVVRYGDYAVDGQEAAYAADSLAERWQRPVTKVPLDPPDCGDLLCTGPSSAVDVLDPATGRTAWRAPDGVSLAEQDGYVLERDADGGAPRRLVDRATGATRVELTGWDAAISTTADQPLVLHRTLPDGRSAFGVVLDDRVQLLGASAGPAGGCVADEGYALCRGDAGLEVWSYAG